MDLTANIKKHENSKNYDQHLLSITLNLCKIYKGFSGNLMIKPTFDAFKKFSNLTYDCPIKPGLYGIKDFAIGDIVVPIPRFQFCARVTLMGFFGRSKKKVHLCNMKYVGVYETNFKFNGR